MTAETDLLPCPFCGEGEHLLVEHLEGTILHPAHRIRCDNCGASTGYTDSDFRADWNARACVSSATEALRAEVDRLLGINSGLCRTSNFHLIDAARWEERAKRAEAEAERLAEALRGWIWARENGASEELAEQYARAALDQETTNGQ